MKTFALLPTLAVASFALAQTPVPDAAEKAQPLGIGAKVPKVAVKSLDGKTVSLPKALGGKTVLVFYRGGWCPFCNRQMDGLQAAQADLQKRRRRHPRQVQRLRN